MVDTSSALNRNVLSQTPKLSFFCNIRRDNLQFSFVHQCQFKLHCLLLVGTRTITRLPTFKLMRFCLSESGPEVCTEVGTPVCGRIFRDNGSKENWIPPGRRIGLSFLTYSGSVIARSDPNWYAAAGHGSSVVNQIMVDAKSCAHRWRNSGGSTNRFGHEFS